MVKLITVTDMMRSFSDIISRVYYKGETFEIKKGNNIVAKLSPGKSRATIAVSELNNFFKASPHLDLSDVDAFAQEIKEIRSLKDNSGANKWE